MGLYPILYRAVFTASRDQKSKTEFTLGQRIFMPKEVQTADLRTCARECDAAVQYQNFSGQKRILETLATICRYLADKEDHSLHANK